MRYYTVEFAYSGNSKIRVYSDSKEISYTIVNDYNVEGYCKCLEDMGFEKRDLSSREVLKHCPKCGSFDVFHRIAYTNPKHHSVKCNFCSHEIGWYDSEEEANRIWNEG